MNAKTLFSVQCPFCHAQIAFYKVKPRLSCPACNSTLGSNRSSVDVWAVLIYVVLVAAVWFVGERVLRIIDASSYLQWGVASAVIGIAAYCLLAPRVLRLGPDSWSRDEPAEAPGNKRKVVGYRTGSGASAEKRSS